MRKTTVFHQVRIFDGKRVLLADTVLVEGDTITAVGSHLELPPEATLVDGTGLTLLPGLIDAHTHTFGPALQQALIFGVTTELDMFTDWRLAKSMKEQQAAGEGEDLPDLRSAGTVITAPGGHGTSLGSPSQPSLDRRRLRILLTPASRKALIISRSCMTTAKAVVDPSIR